MTNPWDVLPKQFLTRLDKLIPEVNQKQVLQSFCEPKVISFRTNTLKTTSVEIMTALQVLNIQASQIPWYKDAFIVNHAEDQSKLMHSQLYTEGRIYFQNLSSMIPVVLLDPKPDEKVLDIAAAPGSKTTQIAALMHNTGEIIANDISRQRLYKLQAVLKHYGVTNTKPYLHPGQTLWRKYPEYFDRVLVDAPCSMEGRFISSDPASYTHWSVKKVKELSVTQRYLQKSAVCLSMHHAHFLRKKMKELLIGY
jgi:16S rRNA C967 or C1407 C5-methylase (RsmB/RsmF family)